MKSKAQELTKWLAQRIQRGDYDLRGFPSGPLLAAELEISRNTAYKVLDLLVAEELLIRKENGRLEVHKKSNGANHAGRIVFLQPSFSSEHFDLVAGVWRRALDKVVSARKVQIRPLIYSDYDDVLIREAVDAFDGVFLFCAATPFPDHLIEFLKSRSQKVVVLGCDLSKHGIRSVRLCSASFLQRLLDHLASLDHQRIDCLNVHPMPNSDVEERIQSWEIWRRLYGLPGRLINAPVETVGVPFDHAFQQAHQAMRRILASGEFTATALFCVSMPAALGAMRALSEAGLEVGRDVSVCAASDEGICRFLSPSLTSLGIPDPMPFLDICLERILSPSLGWDGPALLEPDEADLFVGDSTGPCPNGSQPKV